MDQKKLYQNLPDTPGVYLMKNFKEDVIYVGKAANLKRRVSSYFNRPHEHRIQKMVGEIRDIETRNTDTAIEALILEAELIKKIQPPYNVLEKDDKSFLYVEITKEKFPRVLLVRGKDLLSRPYLAKATKSKGRKPSAAYGPFTSASSLKEAMRILRKIFPWSLHSDPNDPKGIRITQKKARPCFDYEIGLCPGTCVGAITSADYKKRIEKLKMFFAGKKVKLIKDLEKEMAFASKKLEFEEAQRLRRQIFALQHIQDVALIKDDSLSTNNYLPSTVRIEGYDISNLSGESAVGSMVVFVGGEPDKKEYRKFKIQNFSEPNDVGMMKEIIRRRLGNSCPLPEFILVDGGAGQINAIKKVLDENGLRIHVLGMVKGPDRKRTDIIGIIPKGINKDTLIRVRDEAHRFAITYHKQVRANRFFK